MDVFMQFLSEYGTTILYTILTALIGYIGIVLKNTYEKIAKDKTKKDVIRTCVRAVEQIYRDLHGEEKYEMVVENATQMLNEKGINITELEIKMLVEDCVKELNEKTAFIWEDEHTPTEE